MQKLKTLLRYLQLKVSSLKRKIPDEWWIALVGICLIALELVVNG
jgi:hypothetical protein